MLKKFLAVVAAGMCWLVSLSQVPYPSPPANAGNIVMMEYFIDTDPGVGNGKQVAVTPSVNINAFSFNVDLSGVAKGMHRVYVRTKDVTGKWSLTNNAFFENFLLPVYPSVAAAGNVTAIEYFVDTDPGLGNATAVSVNAENIANLQLAVNITGLAKGVHRLYVRSKDANGKWSLSNFAVFDNNSAPDYPSAPAAAGNIVAMEYFIDTDPGAGNATKIDLNGQDVAGLQIIVNVVGLAQGVHHLYVRSKDAMGKWSLNNFSVFDNSTAQSYPAAPVPAPPVGQLEYYFDTDPGFGKGTAVSFTSGTDVNNLSVNIPLGGVDPGMHTLYIRSRQNPWSLNAFTEFSYGKPLPLTWLYVRGELVNQQAQIAWATAQESKTDKFVIEHSIDGRTFTEAGVVQAAYSSSTTKQYSFVHTGVQKGMNYYRIKQLDVDQQFTYSKVITLLNRQNLAATVVAPNPVSNMLHIVVPAAQQPKKADIVDMNGRVVLAATFQSAQQVYSIDVSDLPKGNYIIRLYHAASTETFKILKQ